VDHRGVAILAAGAIVVPIDDLADAEQLDAALVSSAARLIFTTAPHLGSIWRNPAH
jgi:long-subunit acyl-CoA synthetase (AMP-forming)